MIAEIGVRSYLPKKEWNETDKNYRLELCLHELIETSASLDSYADAVVFENEHLSYKELNAQTNQYAHYLREIGTGPNQVVAVMMDRSIEMIIALMAILKAGGAYLPIDPGYPEDRIRFMLQDAAVSIVLIQKKYHFLSETFIGTTVLMDEKSTYISQMPFTNPTNITSPDDLAYIIYTSGSTGKPKGCMLSHKAICNRLLWMKEHYSIGATEKILQKTPFTFDVSVWEFFLPLISGASLHFAKPNGHKDNDYLIQKIVNEKITICHFVPSMLRYFLNQDNVSQCTSLRHVFVSGEALTVDLVHKFKRTLGARLHNLYGPTEAAVDVTYWEAEEREDRVVPIGKPISNIRMYILNSQLSQVAIGETGELFIGGLGLAKGYINQPKLTEEKFIKNPLSDESHSKLYRTGDQARYLEDGNIEFLGRLDFQVKLRGFRIELTEIENILREHESMDDSIVLVRDNDTDDPKLVAYVVAKYQIEMSDIKDYLRKKIPEWMVPNTITPIAKMPLTQHGKVDRGALPWPINSSNDKVTTKAQEKSTDSNLATDLLDIFANLLNIKNLKINDDLFDAGATSFTMVQIVDKIRNKYQITIPIELFLDNPTIKGLVDYLTKKIGIKPESQFSEKSFSKFDIELTNAHIHESFYRRILNHINYSERAISLQVFGEFLSSLMRRPGENKPKYLYASAGALNPVQTYVYVKNNGIEDLAEGFYYYHPVEHSLYLLNHHDKIQQSIFTQSDRFTYTKANFVLFFISQMEAIRPIYSNLSSILSILEAGYMGQLLVDRQADFDLKLFPVGNIAFDEISPYFQLSQDQMYLHCILGGHCANNSQENTNYPLEDFTIALANGKYSSMLKIEMGELQFPTQEDKERVKHNPNINFRTFPEENKPTQLANINFDSIYYYINAAKREYLDRPLSFGVFGQFLTLLKQKTIDDQPIGLYPKIEGKYKIKFYLYIKENGVEGISQGIYFYDNIKHKLIPVSSEPLDNIKSSYTPFNRKHFMHASFCLYLIANLEELKKSYNDASTYLALLEAGYIGQLLLDKQAEFDMGVCPIGTVRFDKIRSAFKIKPEEELIHSFVCGPFHQEAPKNWKFLSKCS